MVKASQTPLAMVVGSRRHL